MSDTRSIDFRTRMHGRYWWFQATKANYVPPIFSFLTDEEWTVMRQWYEETEEKFSAGTGECNVPAMSMLQGIIMGNNLSRIVQCGHFIGFSTLLLGFMMRRMGHKHALFSIDIDPNVTAFTQRVVEKAGLADHVKLVLSDSAAPATAVDALAYLNGAPQLLFIDSSHEYNHTKRELDLWYPRLQPGGFAIMHDVSRFAISFDGAGNGGVKQAVEEWTKGRGIQTAMINDFATDQHYGERAPLYLDSCGLGLIQKPIP